MEGEGIEREEEGIERGELFDMSSHVGKHALVSSVLLPSLPPSLRDRPTFLLFVPPPPSHIVQEGRNGDLFVAK